MKGMGTVPTKQKTTSRRNGSYYNASHTARNTYYAGTGSARARDKSGAVGGSYSRSRGAYDYNGYSNNYNRSTYNRNTKSQNTYNNTYGTVGYANNRSTAGQYGQIGQIESTYDRLVSEGMSGRYSSAGMYTGTSDLREGTGSRYRTGGASTVYAPERYRVPAPTGGAGSRGIGGVTEDTTVTRPFLTRQQRAENKRKLKTRLRYFALVGVLTFMAATLIYRQTAIFGKNREISSLESEYSSVLVTNEGIQTEIDKSIELGNLESVARNQLGMISPDSSQIFYIDMGAKDEVVKSSSSK